MAAANETPVRVTILGSGTSTGVPVLGCGCEVCASTEAKNQRFRSSILLESNSGSKLVIDTGPEFRLQMLRVKVQDLEQVLYTHIHADHCHGFDDLRAFYFQNQKVIQCYLPNEYIEEFKTRFAYAFSESGYLGSKPELKLHALDQDCSRIGDFKIERQRLAHGNVLTSSYRFGAFAYATDFKSFSPEQIEKWRGKIKVMVASGIRFREHHTHSNVSETIKLFQALGVERGIITHLSHDIEYFRDSASLPKQVEFAYDGMSIDLSAILA
ncbi:MAG: MBL fold metallo-hydrolase [Oligoflexales bacterium]|nr:MBL fold metallo-hydrolase [Oligoflexales bacterium]